MGLDQKLQDANARLKAAGSRVVIELRHNSLFLRGTLPPKPGSDKRLPHQQRINLDATFTLAGIQYAETEARRVTNALPRIPTSQGGRRCACWQNIVHRLWQRW